MVVELSNLAVFFGYSVQTHFFAFFVNVNYKDGVNIVLGVQEDVESDVQVYEMFDQVKWGGGETQISSRRRSRDSRDSCN